MNLTHAMEAYLQANQEALRALIRELCAIPAPSRREDARAAFVRQWLEAAGGNPVIDEAKNVICPLEEDQTGEVVVFMAHTDTVFPDLEPLPFREDGEKFYCPGVCDDTANLAVLLICARYFLQNRPQTSPKLVFVANSCEEGLGNLAGSRAVVERYRGRLQALITLDGVELPAVVRRAVGSSRYRVIVRTQGGHSFNDFGRPSAIHGLARLIDALSAQPLPQEADSKTTYNVGLISGGTSVNTIAQEAWMLYEYRSDHPDCLAAMGRQFDELVEAARRDGLDVTVETVGERPCGIAVDKDADRRLMARVEAAMETVLGCKPCLRSGSTDANIPLSLGIPAVCVSACTGSGCHTREEQLELASLMAGSRLCMALLASYCV